MLPNLAGLKPPQGASFAVSADEGLMENKQIDLAKWLKGDILQEFMDSYDRAPESVSGFQVTGVESFDADPDRKRAFQIQMIKETKPKYRDELKKWNNSGGRKIILKYKYFAPPDGIQETEKLAVPLDFDPSIGLTEQQFRRWFLVNNRCSSGTFFFKFAMDCLMHLGYSLVMNSGSLGRIVVKSVHELDINVPLALNPYQLTRPEDPFHNQPNDAAWPTYGPAIGGSGDPYMGHKILLLRVEDEQRTPHNVYVDVTARQVYPDMPLGTDVLIMPGDAKLKPEYTVSGERRIDKYGAVTYDTGRESTKVFIRKIMGCNENASFQYMANMERVLRKYVTRDSINITSLLQRVPKLPQEISSGAAADDDLRGIRVDPASLISLAE